MGSDPDCKHTLHLPRCAGHLIAACKKPSTKKMCSDPNCKHTIHVPRCGHLIAACKEIAAIIRITGGDHKIIKKLMNGAGKDKYGFRPFLKHWKLKRNAWRYMSTACRNCLADYGQSKKRSFKSTSIVGRPASERLASTTVEDQEYIDKLTEELEEALGMIENETNLGMTALDQQLSVSVPLEIQLPFSTRACV